MSMRIEIEVVAALGWSLISTHDNFRPSEHAWYNRKVHAQKRVGSSFGQLLSKVYYMVILPRPSGR